MKKLLVLEPSKCTGCRTCEIVCSLGHVKTSNPVRSRIKVFRGEFTGHQNVPIVCQQCEKPVCRDVCPVGAFREDREMGIYLVDEEICIGCRMCELVCPFGGVSIDHETGVATKCDLCEGDPACVKYCDPGALTYLNYDQIGITRKRDGIRRISEMLNLISAKEK